MDDNLVGYLLNALDPDTHRQVQAHLQQSADARGRLEALRRVLEPLAADRAEPAAPSGLAVRTLGRVAEYCCRELPRAPLPPSARAAGASRRFWRRADVLVAAAVLVTVLGVGLSWVVQSRAAANIEACKNNLRVFYAALRGYADHRANRLPDVAAVEPPRNVAGMVAPILIDAGTLPRDADVGCPASSAPRTCPLTLPSLRQLDAETFKRHAEELICCYAYSLGYRDGESYHGPRFDPDQPNHLLPVMADRPPRNPAAGNSPNHGGTGQNVLFLDGHVGFFPTRNVGLNQDDIYLNRDRQQAAGLDFSDAVLGSSDSSP
jgi:prepilin-type processing-associated H-X9-DG protein